MARERPYMRFWVADWLADAQIQAMTREEEHAYFRLLLWNWQEGWIPDDPKKLSRLVRIKPFRMTRLWSTIKPHFTEIEPGKFSNKRLQVELAHYLEVCETKRRAGACAKHMPKQNETSSESESESDADVNPSSPLSGDEGLGVEKSERELLQGHVDYFNLEVAPKLHAPRVEKLTDARARHLAARLADYPDLWQRVLAEIPHLNQFAREKRFVTFDFLMSPKGLQKLLEGNYRSKA